MFNVLFIHQFVFVTSPQSRQSSFPSTLVAYPRIRWTTRSPVASPLLLAKYPGLPGSDGCSKPWEALEGNHWNHCPFWSLLQAPFNNICFQLLRFEPPCAYPPRQSQCDESDLFWDPTRNEVMEHSLAHFNIAVLSNASQPWHIALPRTETLFDHVLGLRPLNQVLRPYHHSSTLGFQAGCRQLGPQPFDGRFQRLQPAANKWLVKTQLKPLKTMLGAQSSQKERSAHVKTPTAMVNFNTFKMLQKRSPLYRKCRT